jgi:hypothetical protein
LVRRALFGDASLVVIDGGVAVARAVGAGEHWIRDERAVNCRKTADTGCGTPLPSSFRSG